MRSLLFLLALPFAAASSGCNLNLFNLFESPSSEAQILSRARGCFDRGDVDCARREYSKLQGTGQAEVAASELAFALLDEAGAGLEAFITSMNESEVGGKVTKMANALAAHREAPGLAKRQKVLEAYRKVAEITTNTELRGLVRFTSAFVLAAEILAEDAGTDGVLDRTDINLGSCDTTSCALNATSCAGTHNVVVGGSTYDFLFNPMPEAARFEVATPDWGMFDWALSATNQGLSEFGAGQSGLTSGAGGLDSAIVEATSSDKCYRYAVASNGIGEP